MKSIREYIDIIENLGQESKEKPIKHAQRLNEGKVPKENHRKGADTTADIEVTGVNPRKKTYDITYNGTPLLIVVNQFMKDDFDYYQIADYEISIIKNNKRMNSESEKWERLADTIIAYLDINNAHDNQLMAWHQVLEFADFFDSNNNDLENLFNDIEHFDGAGSKQMQEDVVWLMKNLQNSREREAFKNYATQRLANKKQPKSTPLPLKGTLYLGFSYSKEGSTEMMPGMNLPSKIKLNDPNDDEEKQERINDILSKVKFKFDNLEDELIDIAAKHGIVSPDLGSGFGGRDLYWDVVVSIDANIPKWANAILETHKDMEKYLKSFNASLTKIGLPGIKYGIWKGVLADNLTEQQEQYFSTIEGFNNLATGKIDIAKMVSDNIAAGYRR